VGSRVDFVDFVDWWTSGGIWDEPDGETESVLADCEGRQEGQRKVSEEPGRVSGRFSSNAQTGGSLGP